MSVLQGSFGNATHILSVGAMTDYLRVCVANGHLGQGETSYFIPVKHGFPICFQPKNGELVDYTGELEWIGNLACVAQAHLKENCRTSGLIVAMQAISNILQPTVAPA